MPGPSPLVTTIVQAGAGTGKTESLAKRILAVAEALYDKSGGKLPRLVATTFTERATSELRERVTTLLAGRDTAPLWLKEYVTSDRLQIGTIHGTLSLILHKFGSHLGLDPEFTIADSEFEKMILTSSIRHALQNSPALNVVLEHYSFGDLIGIMRRLVSHYYSSGDKFCEARGWRDILAEVAKQLREALNELAVADTSNLSEKTGARVQQLQKLEHELSSLHDPVLYKDLFLAKIVEIKKPSIQEGKRGFELKPVLTRIYEFRDLWSKDTFLTEVNERHDEIAPLLCEMTKAVAADARRRKTEAGVLSFDDLEFLCLELILGFPEVAESIRQDHDFWFVDEYQDTSPLQKKLIFELLRESKNAYFVGDPQQSIYLFRGADENVFQETKAFVEKIGGAVERLTKNFRSHPDLLKFLNHLFLNFKKPVEVLEPKSPYEGSIHAEIVLGSENCTDAVLVTEQCLKFRNEGHAFHEIAILVRTNDKARSLAQTLSSSGVPVYIHSSGGFYDRREVIDALAILSFIENPSDDGLFVLIARSPWLGISDQDIALWGKAREKKTFWDYITANQIFENHTELRKVKTAISEVHRQALSFTFEKLIEDLGFFEYCLLGDASGRREANLRKLLWKLREEERKPHFLASRFIDAAWREADASSSEETEAASFIEPCRVNILTIHKSKGLKFNCVIVPFCGEAPRPKSQLVEASPSGTFAVGVLAADSEERVSPIVHRQLREKRWQRERDEEARVFYVAVTRAAEKLCLVARQKINAGSWLGQIPLDLSPGEHPGLYRVSFHEENPIIEKLKFDEDVSPISEISAISEKTYNKKKNHFTVTGAVGLLSKKDDEAKEEKIIDGNRLIQNLFIRMDAQQRGQAIHFIFEELKKDLSQDLEALCALSMRKFNVKQPLETERIAQTLKMKEPPLAKLIARGFTEWPFEFRQGERSFEGQIDLWGEVDGVTWVIDYKSAKRLTKEALDSAQNQLEIYALAISKMGISWDKIKLAVVAPYEGVSHLLSSRSREEIVASFDSLDPDLPQAQILRPDPFL